LKFIGKKKHFIISKNIKGELGKLVVVVKPIQRTNLTIPVCNSSQELRD
jgi:hypothetical protein